MNSQVIDNRGFSFDDDGQTFRHSAHKLLVKLSENCGILPPALSVTGIQNYADHPTAGGGFADIFLANYQGKQVALKRLRNFQVQSREGTHRVRQFGPEP